MSQQRNERVWQVYQADSKWLSISDLNYKQWVFRYTFLELEKDLGKNGDISSEALLPFDRAILARVLAKSDGVICGVEELDYFLNRADMEFMPRLKDRVRVEFLVKDGDQIKSGDQIAKLFGNGRDVLMVERVFLNLLIRMSSVATVTREMIATTSGRCHLAATRKTLWGLLDKKAVMVGGGLTHRLNLSDAVMVKDNHLAIFGENFGEILRRCDFRGRFLEVELSRKFQFRRFFSEFKDLQVHSPVILMCDNMGALEIFEVLEMARKIGVYEKLIFEASGGISRDNLAEYAESGVDVISMGALTNSARVFDASLEVLSVVGREGLEPSRF